MDELPHAFETVPADKPVLLAGPTASGKSALALALAERQGRTIVNADAIQVHSAWRILSARPSPSDEARAEHALYGHVPWGDSYSVGHWVREVVPYIARRPAPIIVGGTGLFLSALTEGLVEIPPITASVRAEADDRIERLGHAALFRELDEATADRIDGQNPARVQRAWEVLHQTGRGLATWQAETGPPLLPLSDAAPFVLGSLRDDLGLAIERRFDAMLAAGALGEVASVLPVWDPKVSAAKAIGAPELASHLRGKISLDEARDQAVIATRRYAKRQQTWFRSRMKAWQPITLRGISDPP